MLELPEGYDPEKTKETFGTTATQSLFLESAKPEFKPTATFSLGVLPKDGYLWFKPIYIKYTLEDTSEYTLALKVFHSWKQWDRIRKNKLVQEYLNPIKEERDIAIQSVLYQSIMEEATSGRSKLQAAKYLIDNGFQPGGKGSNLSGKGTRASRKSAAVLKDVDRIHSEALSRMNLDD